jgi:hypothetical protein
VDDLAAFLRERLDNEAELARATMSRANPQEGVWTFAEMQVRDDAGHLVVRHTWPNEGEHIARHDPARTLREVEAKRRIIELHELAVSKDPARFSALTGEPLPDAYEVTCAVCGWADDDPTSGCETLRLLALPHADHEDYREEWRP